MELRTAVESQRRTQLVSLAARFVGGRVHARKSTVLSAAVGCTLSLQRASIVAVVHPPTRLRDGAFLVEPEDARPGVFGIFARNWRVCLATAFNHSS